VKSTDASHSVGVAPCNIGRSVWVYTINKNSANSSLLACDEAV
jgi:hypothetical protein